MKTIPLTQGKVALIDDEDAELVSSYVWAAVNYRTVSGLAKWYARGRKAGTSGSQVSMHQLISGIRGVDHRNGEGLDNRRSNLRVATHPQNCANRQGVGKFGFRGVSLGKNCVRRFVARIKGGDGPVRLGYFDTPEGAARAYDAAARMLWGEFACVNFPNPGERSAITGAIVPAEAELQTA